MWKQNLAYTAYIALRPNENLFVLLLRRWRIHCQMFLSRVSQNSAHETDTVYKSVLCSFYKTPAALVPFLTMTNIKVYPE